MLVPGIILGYLAYRGILNDQALREKQARLQLESVSEEFFEGLTSALNKVVLADSTYIPTSSEHALLRFIQKPNKEEEILSHNLLYLPKGYVESTPENSTGVDWEKGWRLEFAEKNLQSAISFYQDVSDKSENESDILKALVALARIQMKQHSQVEAIGIYERITQNHSHQNLNSLPSKPMALLEIYKVRISSGDIEEANRVHSQLINTLLQPSSEYEKTHFSFFLNQLDSKDSLYPILLKKQLKTDQAIQVFNEAELLFNGAVTNPFKRYYQQKDDILTFISYAYPDGSKTGLVLELIPFIQSNQKDLFSILNETDNIIWRIEGNPAWFVDSEDEAEWISFPFPDQLPDWDLKMSVIKPSRMSTILAPGNGVFLLIFIFIILIMLFGLAFTIHILNQELKLNRLRTEFISNVSHELKSPLTSIRQMTEMLNDKRIDSEDQRSDYYGIMLDQSEHLSHLIDNILDFSRMEEDRKYYRFEEFDLVPLISKLVVSFQYQLSERKFVLKFQSELNKIMVYADKEAIIQVIYNLVDNAIKFSGLAKEVKISLSQEEFVSISIQDFGMGISKKDLDKIFDRFYRSSESQKLAIKGSGIGLTLVQRIIEAHKGRVEVESRINEGSTFNVYIPTIKQDTNEKDITD